MTRLITAFTVALALSGAAPSRVAAQFDGTWSLSVVLNGLYERPTAIVKVKVVDGKASGELVSGDPRLKLALKSISLDKNNLHIVLRNVNTDIAFEFAPRAGEDKRFRGSVLFGALNPALMSPTNLTKLELRDVAMEFLRCPPMRQANELLAKSTPLRDAAVRAKDPDKKKAILQRIAEADAAAKKQTPALYREVLAKYADSPAVFTAALNLLRTARANEAAPADMKQWAAIASKAARAYGPRWQGDYAGQLAGFFLAQEGMEKLGLDYARQAEKALAPKTPAEQQVRTLSLVARALRKNGKNDEAKTLDARIATLDEALDREYAKTMPPFKGKAFTGRKSKSDRAVFLELFTGATCPPCVAADLAFDVLTKTYKPSDLVLVQYHLHIPGPDPMTNPDTEARWSYYTEAFPKDVGGVPSSIFNGKPAAKFGGSVANAAKKYAQYREVIDPLLEEAAAAKLSVTAMRKGDRIDITAEVSAIAEPGRQKKLRILLAEETVRYAGSNKIRFHHHVVRAFPGGAAGKSLLEASSKHQASIDLGVLRGNLNKYLDEYQTNKRPFLNPARPLEFEHLSVIAFVQDDSTHEILQAVQVEVKGK